MPSLFARKYRKADEQELEQALIAIAQKHGLDVPVAEIVERTRSGEVELLVRLTRPPKAPPLVPVGALSMTVSGGVSSSCQ